MKPSGMFLRFLVLALSASLVLAACELPPATVATNNNQPPAAVNTNPAPNGVVVGLPPAAATGTASALAMAQTATAAAAASATANANAAATATAQMPVAPQLTPISQDVNCRFGPGTDYASVGFVKVGVTVPILGTNQDHSWWQIQNLQDIPGSMCWVSGPLVNTLGDISKVPTVQAPSGLVTSVTISVSPGAVVHGTCGGPNPVDFSMSVTTNGPATVNYYIQIFNGDNTNRTPQLPATLTFASASTQTFDPGGSYHTDCGSYYIKGVITSPNSVSTQTNWKVVNP